MTSALLYPSSYFSGPVGGASLGSHNLQNPGLEEETPASIAS